MYKHLTGFTLGRKWGQKSTLDVRNKEVYSTEPGTPLSPPPSENPACHWSNCCTTLLWLAGGLVTERLLFLLASEPERLWQWAALIHAVVEPHFGIWRTINAARAERMKVCLHGTLWKYSPASRNSISNLFVLFREKAKCKSPQTGLWPSLILARTVWGFAISG